MSSLDFFKSCTTNVRVVEDLFAIQYSQWVPQESTIDRSVYNGVLRDLRKRNVLCAVVGKELWIFGTDPEAADISKAFESYEDRFILQASGSVSSDPQKRIGHEQSLKHVFLSAIEASISFTLAESQAMLHVGSWTWLYQPLEEGTKESASILLNLRTSLSDNGVLYISNTTHESFLNPVRDPTTPQDVLVAPSGRYARLASDSLEENGQTGYRSQMKMSAARWRKSVVDSLSAEGIYIQDSDDWSTIELTEKDEVKTALWPTRLCLKQESCASSVESISWRKWFASDSSQQRNKAYKDPIAEAEEWFVQASSASNNESSEPVEARALSTDAHTMFIESPLATSPPFNQRLVDHQAAMSGIYPTPPDGLLPAHLVGQNSTSDIPTDVLQNDQTTQLLGSDDTQQDARGQSYSAEPTNLTSSGLGMEDLFGDVGALDDEFGATEIGDADFDYFDEPDDTVDEIARSEKDIEMVDTSSPVEAKAPIHPADDALNESVSQEAGFDAEMRPEGYGDHGDSFVIRDETQLLGTAPGPAETDMIREVEKPLSPFHIREQLLPPPIPASAAQQQTSHLRRRSTFDPTTFNKDLDLTARYSKYSNFHSTDSTALSGPGDVLKPFSNKRKRSSGRKPSHPDSGVDDMDSTESSDDASDDTSRINEDGYQHPPMKLPWDTQKRRQASMALGNHSATATDPLHTDSETTEAAEAINVMYRLLTLPAALEDLSRFGGRSNAITDVLPSIGTIHELTKLDLVYIAQIASEQAVTATGHLAAELQDHHQVEDPEGMSMQSAIAAIAAKAIDHLLPSVEECDISRLALMKEPPPRTPSVSGKSPQTPHPHLHTRHGSMHLGPDFFAIAPPYVHIHRGSEAWEVLPPALSFWSELGLSPANGQKNIMVLSVIPENEDLQGQMKDFLVDLKRAYEGCKMGNLDLATAISNEADREMVEFSDGLAVIRPSDRHSISISETLIDYAQQCTQLGMHLAELGGIDPARTIVICMVNLFGENALARQHLCACFWLLCKAYHETASKARKNADLSDMDLQILPISLIASFDGPVILNAKEMKTLAAEIYDRCPPAINAPSDPAPISSILSAPAVELSSPPPKRIGFQLTAEPPSNLLHEGSILHLAYALSRDGEWMTVYWVDSTARYRRIFSAPLRGKSFQDVAADVWTETLEIISAREVMWRIFVVACGNDRIDESIQACWKEIVSRKARKQVLHVTLLSATMDPPLQLTPGAIDLMKITHSENTPGGGFLTPVSTPQASTFTVSPDASGQNTAPLTPAPSDTVANVLETDPDAHLVDTADETWGMLLASTYATGYAVKSKQPQASGILFQRGDAAGKQLEALGVDLHWDVRIRPNAQIDDGPPRQAEATLREVLKMYRNLSVLTKARCLKGLREDFMPVHALNALRGADALDGFLKDVE